MVADLSFPEFHLHLSTSAAFWESVAFVLQAVSQALCFLIAGARLTPGVPLHCLGALMMYTRFTELKEWWEDACCCLVPSPVGAALLLSVSEWSRRKIRSLDKAIPQWEDTGKK